MMMVNLLTNKVTRLKDSFFTPPTSFIYLTYNLKFLAFEEHQVTLWNLKGEQVGTFEDHSLVTPHSFEDSSSIIHITQAQDIIISLCEDSPEEDEVGGSSSTSAPPSSSIHVSSIMTGRCLARINSRATAVGGGGHITALAYSDETGDIITGDDQGYIHIWSN
eukprot:CAMPEP_0174699842 /NCGR_PEP_ID=MMETSP1094-20130205/4994_1 /TAXON_ID=156173 /ORGANISM="Chrysochromulina brevifilum, Strain UTEX LB 985" /LENGTH=162 /DNA_ID=CAMNT_0015897245 /DNA_START=9 /DNA_END=497 /DNA_ORIENTATION=-